mmetsp:Transcript_82166/g.241240  ORF Transcript_82166/g.241240 Transcript_82166/m.241240 type:complete len:205 (-) Transcript_82166:338-952(-)
MGRRWEQFAVRWGAWLQRWTAWRGPHPKGDLAKALHQKPRCRRQRWSPVCCARRVGCVWCSSPQDGRSPSATRTAGRRSAPPRGRGRRRSGPCRIGWPGSTAAAAPSSMTTLPLVAFCTAWTSRPLGRCSGHGTTAATTLRGCSLRAGACGRSTSASPLGLCLPSCTSFRRPCRSGATTGTRRSAPSARPGAGRRSPSSRQWAT